MAESQAQFDTILATLSPALTSLQASVAALVAASQSSGVDLSSEVATVQADLAQIGTIASSIPSTPAPTPPASS